MTYLLVKYISLNYVNLFSLGDIKWNKEIKQCNNKEPCLMDIKTSIKEGKKYKHILIHTMHKWHRQSKLHAEFKQTCFLIFLQKAK